MKFGEDMPEFGDDQPIPLSMLLRLRLFVGGLPWRDESNVRWLIGAIQNEENQ